MFKKDYIANGQENETKMAAIAGVLKMLTPEDVLLLLHGEASFDMRDDGVYLILKDGTARPANLLKQENPE